MPTCFSPPSGRRQHLSRGTRRRPVRGRLVRQVAAIHVAKSMCAAGDRLRLLAPGATHCVNGPPGQVARRPTAWLLGAVGRTAAVAGRR